ncbi:4'-phosphopantetheinyl transferase [Aquirhabdus sp.]|uniref:4'-phosphopantetheinyl transferase family protein n=1 Tax=Aquirhabdus sp. TaxID=2824160 RepID=UPI00396C4F48
MTIVKLKLPEGVHCESHVFRSDEYAEIVHLFPESIRDLARNLPDGLSTASPQRRASFLSGRLTAIHALQRFSCTEEQLKSVMGRTAQGLPIFPVEFIGSITHNILEKSGLAIAVIARKKQYTSIAIDCETIFSIDQANDIATLITSTNELRLGERVAIRREEWLTMIYSLKETLFKLLFFKVNQFMPFEAAEVLSFDETLKRACLMLMVDWGDLPAGQRFWLNVEKIGAESLGEQIVSFGTLKMTNI